MATWPVLGSTFWNDHLRTFHVPAEASPAPKRPPRREWLELVGRPKNQVMMFQVAPAAIAQKTVASVMNLVSTRPAPIVLATAVPPRAPTKLQKEAQMTAWGGVRTWVA